MLTSLILHLLAEWKLKTSFLNMFDASTLEIFVSNKIVVKLPFFSRLSCT